MDGIELIREGKLIKVSQKILEGKKERIVNFQGRVLKVRGKDENKTITVRQYLDGVGVDRIFPVSSPTITKFVIVEETKNKEKKASKKKTKK